MLKRAVGIVLAIYCLSLSAMAADVPVKAQPAVNPIIAASWTGFYAGIRGGGASLRGHSDPTSGSPEGFADGSGAVLGGVVGANWQFAERWLIGAEGDWSWSAATADVRTKCDTHCTIKLNSVATVRGRGGVLIFENRLLLYVAGGAAFLDIKDSCGSPLCEARVTATGWTAGGGIEGRLIDRWTWQAEYLYIQAAYGHRALCPGGVCVPPIPDLSFTAKVNVLRAGVIYHF